MQGVERTKDEIEELKGKIAERMASGYGTTFTGACQSEGVGISEAYTWRKEDEGFDRRIQDARVFATENALDLCESKAMKKISEEDRKTILFFLERKGKHRGYAARTELTGNAGKGLIRPISGDEPMTEEEMLQLVRDKTRRIEQT